MRTKFLLTCLVLTLSFVSCKNEEKKDGQEVVGEIKKENPKTFKVIFKVLAKKDDSFHLYYSEDGTLNFPEDTSIWVQVKGSSTPQDVVFEIPEDHIPTQLRVDFNSVQKEEELQILNFRMKYFNSEFTAEGKYFFDYFGPNEETIEFVDKDKVIFKPKNVAGKRYAPPSFYPSEVAMKNRIDQVVKAVK
ncbi:hypothetical protein [Flavobacterium sp.]|jgi:hypothetical protein|uniref:hypothetical protein n=1 Tax=Flavobacterium sp. TaxID=239 RepID=UPI0037C1516B